MRRAAVTAVARRQPATLLLALILLLTASILPNVRAAAAPPDETFADDFQSLTFNGSTGSLPWTEPWQEHGEADGPGAGAIQINNEPNCAAQPCLLLGRASHTDTSIDRRVDLSRFASATLSFTYKVHAHIPGAGQAHLLVSDDDGGSWTQLDSWPLDANTGQATVSYDISAHIASNTMIKFAVTGNTDESHMNVDNLEIAANGALCYLIGDSGGVHGLTSLKLSDLDPLAAESTIGDTGADLRAIALDPAGGELYAATGDQLHQVDTATGAATTIGSFGSSGSTVFDQIEALAFDPTTGVLYASHYRPGDTDLIIQLDPATGSMVTDAFGAGVDYVAFTSDKASQRSLLGLAIDPTGQMWGMATDGNSQQKLHTIDKLTGVSTSVTNSRTVSGLSFDPQGKLWGVVSAGSIWDIPDENTNRLVDNLTSYTGIACDAGATTITDSNRPPVVDPIGDQTVAEGDAFSLAVSGSDPDATIPALSSSGLPGWASFFDNGDGTASITGTPGYSDAGVATVTLTASDGSLSVDTTFDLTVTDTNRSPVFDVDQQDRTDPEGTAVSFAAAAADPDLDSLTYTAIGLPGGVTIDPLSGDISGTIAFGASGTYAVEITVTDAGAPGLSASDSFVWTVTDVNLPPVLDLIGDQIGPEETAISFTAAATDPDADDLIFSLAGAPAGADIDPTSGVFAWTPGEVHGVGSYTLTVVVTDDGEPGLTDSQVVTITVTEVNRAPSIAPIPDQSSMESAAVFVPVTATDPDLPANILSFSATGLPPGLTVDPSTGAISGTVSTDAAGHYPVSVAVTDNATPPLLATATFDWKITARNRPPALDAIAPQTVAEETTVSFTARATDPEADRISFSITGAPAGAAIDRATGLFTWTPDETHGPGTYRMTVLATDNGSPTLRASEEVAITVTETNRAPAVTAIADRSNDAGDSVSFSAIATDPDLPSNTITYTAVGLPPGLSIEPDSGLISGIVGIDPRQPTPTYAVEVTVTDDGAPELNDSTSFTWTVTAVSEPDPNTAPIIDPIEDRYTDVGSIVSFAVSARDEEPLAYSASGLPPGLAIDRTTGLISGTVGDDAVGTHAVTITVTDTGLPAMTATGSFSLTVTDVVAAEIKEELVAALDGFVEPGPRVVEPQSPPIRRSLVVMGSAAAATTESLRWPFGLLVALLVGFATVGRVGLYPLLWRGERHRGMINFYDPELEFGLIDPDAGGEAIFVHAHAFPRRQRQNLQIGTRIRYRLLASDNRASAWGATTEDDHA